VEVDVEGTVNWMIKESPLEDKTPVLVNDGDANLKEE